MDEVRTQLIKALGAMSIAERQALAASSGVPYNTVHKYSYEYNAPLNGSYRTMSRLWAAVQGNGKSKRRVTA